MIRCIVKDCPTVSQSEHQPEPGWLLLKASEINSGGILVQTAAGSMCPDCRGAGALAPLRTGAEQVLPPEKPKEEEPPAEEVTATLPSAD